MKAKNIDSSEGVDLSRREFIKTVAVASTALAAGPLLAFRSGRVSKSRETGPAAFRYSMDQDWLFGGRFKDGAIAPAFDDSAFKRVTIPHCVAKLSWQNWNPADWEDVWIYRRHFSLPRESEGRRVFVSFDGVMAGATPTINGHTLPQHLGGYLPFSYEITDRVRESDNVIALAVDSRWKNVPPTGTPNGVTGIDFLLPGGIHRPVYLKVVPQVFIDDVFAKPVDVLDENRSVEVSCSINAAHAVRKPVVVRAELRDGDKTLCSSEREYRIHKSSMSELALTLTKPGNVRLWDVNDPYLYDVVVTLLMDGVPVHDYSTRVGLRDARFEVDGFFLNGRRLQIFGLDRHELFPYVGYAMPSGVMRRDAVMIRQQLNCNMVRCSHYPQSEAFLNACDDNGLLVWEEVPGWSYIGDDTWMELMLRDVRDMVVRDRNHPSVIVWGVRANETNNYPELWGTAKAIAKSLDDSRQTTGALLGRYRSTDHWLQDLFASNDYTCNHRTGIMKLKEPVAGVPYMVSEAVGQVVGVGPTREHVYRRGGDPELQEKQAIYHAQAHDQAAQYRDNSGVTAWCAFDYASLNKNAYNGIKYPGVADIFRAPKLGASFYKAQVDPGVRPVIETDFYWDFGADSQRGTRGKAAIFSNCEMLRLYVDDKLLSEVHPDRRGFPNVAYPPSFADLDTNGLRKPELRIDGLIGSRIAISKSYSADRSLDRFSLETDAGELKGDGVDMVRLVFKVVDKYGEDRLNAGGSVSFGISGPGVVVGDNPFQLESSGGVAAVWIKSIPGGIGKIEVIATHSDLGRKSVEVMSVKPPDLARV